VCVCLIGVGGERLYTYHVYIYMYIYIYDVACTQRRGQLLTDSHTTTTTWMIDGSTLKPKPTEACTTW
jgi:hypothetical protein